MTGDGVMLEIGGKDVPLNLVSGIVEQAGDTSSSTDTASTDEDDDA